MHGRLFSYCDHGVTWKYHCVAVSKNGWKALSIGRVWKGCLHFGVNRHLPLLQTVDLLFLSESSKQNVLC